MTVRAEVAAKNREKGAQLCDATSTYNAELLLLLPNQLYAAMFVQALLTVVSKQAADIAELLI